MGSPADTNLSCDPRHRLCRDCANDPRLLRCPLCRSTLQPRIPPPAPDDPTYVYFHIQIYNNRLLTYTDYCATVNPPLQLAYNVWRRLTSTTGQLWEVHLKTDLPYYHIARHRLHVLTDTRDEFQMAISIRYRLNLVQPSQHDLLLEYDITVWVPADHPLDMRHDMAPHATPDVAYPQHTQWVPDGTQDGDVEPNPNPDNNAPLHGMVRTMAENYERNTSGLILMHTTKGRKTPRTPSRQPHTPHRRITRNRNPPRTGNLAHHPTITQTGLATPPLPPRRMTDIKDKESSCPTGFTYGYPRERERLDSQRLRRIDRIHTTPDLLSLATSVYPMFAANSDHKAIVAEFTPPSFETEDTVPRFYCPETILQDSEAMEDLETSLKSINSTGDQWWEEALGCIQKKAVS